MTVAMRGLFRSDMRRLPGQHNVQRGNLVKRFAALRIVTLLRERESGACNLIDTLNETDELNNTLA